MLRLDDDYIIPKIALKSNFQSTRSPTRYVVKEDNVTSLYNEYETIFENIQ